MTVATLILWAALSMSADLPADAMARELAADSGGWKIRQSVVAEIMWVAERTGISPLILGSIVGKESGGGRPWLIRYCLDWRPIEGGRSCVRQATCWEDCLRPEVWDNRLDSGLWGLRDAPLPASSWLRRHRRVTGRAVDPRCPMRPRCRRKLMAWIVQDLHKWEVRDCPFPCVGGHGWLSRWNGCGACVNHVQRAWAKSLAARTRRLFNPAHRLIGGASNNTVQPAGSTPAAGTN